MKLDILNYNNKWSKYVLKSALFLSLFIFLNDSLIINFHRMSAKLCAVTLELNMHISRWMIMGLII